MDRLVKPMCDVIKTHQYENLTNQASYASVMNHDIIMSLSDGVLYLTEEMDTITGACYLMYSFVAIPPLAYGTEFKKERDVM